MYKERRRKRRRHAAIEVEKVLRGAAGGDSVAHG